MSGRSYRRQPADHSASLVTIAPRRIALVIFALGALSGCTSQAPAAGSGPVSVGRASYGIEPPTPGYFGGVVATSSRRATEAAADVLRRGGNAIDAAAVAQFMLNVVEPESSGIGGGSFTLIYSAADRETVAIDARETAPAAAEPGMFLDEAGGPIPFARVSTSGVAIGVPGALRGIELALGRWGTISLAEAVAPAVAAAESGIVVDDRLATTSADARLRTGCAAAGEPGSGPTSWDEARKVFAVGARPGECGRPLRAGETLRQPELARTLRLLGERGAGAFYDCADPSGLARALIRAQAASRPDLGARGAGRMTCADLAGYRPILREPVSGEYRGLVVRSVPAPSSGGIALVQILKMLSRFPLGDHDGAFGPGGAARLNVIQEAMRLAFADRAVWVGDPEHNAPLPLRGLIDDRYLRLRADTCPDGDPAQGAYCITPGARLPQIREGDPWPFEGVAPQTRRSGPAAGDWAEGGDTTHLTIVDRWGNIVTCTTTVEAPWGTGLMVPGFGFLLNNQLTDFNRVPRRRGAPGDADWDPGADDVGPGKRPRSSMTPTIVFRREGGEERPVAAFGSPGGPTIINTVLGFLIRLVDDGMSPEQAVRRPRLSLASAADDAVTEVEPGFDEAVLGRLREIGYRLAPSAGIGAVQAVVLDPVSGAATGVADPRRNGLAIGLP